MSNKLYVGGLSYSTTQEVLADLFQEAGQVMTSTIITDRETGRSKGFGFVEMSSQDGASEAISKFNGYKLDGRSLNVNEAREKTPRAASGGSRW